MRLGSPQQQRVSGGFEALSSSEFQGALHRRLLDRRGPVVDCSGSFIILGLYRDNGKENGNYRDYRGYILPLQADSLPSVFPREQMWTVFSEAHAAFPVSAYCV